MDVEMASDSGDEVNQTWIQSFAWKRKRHQQKKEVLK